MTIKDEMSTYISVDVETAGSIPSCYALLSIGACTLGEPRRTFYVELRPDQPDCDPKAMAVHGLDMQTLSQSGLPPAEALARFSAWLQEVVPAGQQPLFVAFNAPFDWMFINDYYIRYTGNNPFGHSAIDIKAVYMGAARKPWKMTSGKHLHKLYHDDKTLSHNALQDAVDQAVIFERILAEMEKDSPQHLTGAGDTENTEKRILEEGRGTAEKKVR